MARHAGVVLVVAAVLWAGGGLISRAAPISGPGLAFWRCLLGAAAYQAVLVARGRRPTWGAVRASWLGGLGFGLSVVCLFVAFKTTTLLSATVIGSLQPLALGLLTHRTTQRLGPVLWASSAAAAAGTVVVVVGSSARSGDWSLTGDLFAAAGVAANMVYVLGTKRAREHLPALDYQATMLWVAAAVVLPIAAVTSRGALVPEPAAWWSIVALVAVGGTGHILFSMAQHHVSVAASSAILLTEVLAVAVGAAVLFDQPIGVIQMVGMAVVAAAVGVWLALDPGEPAEHATALESTTG